MIRYISLLTFTEKGISDIGDSTHRAQEFADLAKQSGVTVEGQYWTTRSRDGLLVLAAEKECCILRVLSELASRGYVRTESMKAFTASDFDSVLKG